MHLLFLNHFYAPDPAPTGQLLADLVAHLESLGHHVEVVCARAAYAQAESRPSPGRVRRLWTPRFSRSQPARLLSYACFYAGALAHALRGPEIVVTLTTPPLLELAGALAGKLRGSRHYIWEMDVYPEVAVALGALRPGSLAERLCRALSAWARRNADGVLALGPCMKQVLESAGVPRVTVVENWAPGDPIAPREPLDDGRLEILYSGNLGLAHDMDTVAAAMDRLKSDPRIRFTFAGGGARRPALETFCRERAIPARFLAYQPADEMEAHLAACDLGLVTQRPETLGLVVPSKIYALMAAGRPILFIGPRASTAARTIEAAGCGWQIDPGDVEAAAALLNLLAENIELARTAGQRARSAFLNRYDRPIALARITEILTSQIALRAPSAPSASLR